MVDFSLRRTTQWGLALVGVALLAGNATKAHAVVIAYEGFNYAPAKIVDMNGDDIYDDGLGVAGGGWAGPWDNLQGVTPDASVVQAGSLTYTDGLGNSLTTSGGKLINTGALGNSQPARTLAARRDGVTLGATETTPVSTWMSFLAIRTGAKNAVGTTPAIRVGTYGRGANLSLFDSTLGTAANEEKLNLGENSNFQAPLTTGNDLLRLQQAAVVDPAQIELFKKKFGKSSTLGLSGYDMWMMGAPRVNAALTAQAAPPLNDPDLFDPMNADPAHDDYTGANIANFSRNPVNGRLQSYLTNTPFGLKVDLMLLRIDHFGGATPKDKATIWMNPNLNSAPSDANASAVLDLAALNARGIEQGLADGAAFNTATGNLFSFDRIRLFAGNVGLPNELAEWSLDEIRLGETFGDVTPHGAPAVAAVPEPGTLVLAAAALAAVRGLRRRK
jgi:hypothetical protein